MVSTRQFSLCSISYIELLQIALSPLQHGLVSVFQFCNVLQLGLVSFVTFLVFVAFLGVQPCSGLDKLAGYLSQSSVVLFELEFHLLDEGEVFALLLSVRRVAILVRGVIASGVLMS